jgi:hypothetical protein
LAGICKQRRLIIALRAAQVEHDTLREKASNQLTLGPGMDT